MESAQKNQRARVWFALSACSAFDFVRTRSRRSGIDPPSFPMAKSSLFKSLGKSVSLSASSGAARTRSMKEGPGMGGSKASSQGAAIVVVGLRIRLSVEMANGT